MTSQWRPISTAPQVHPLAGGDSLLLAWVAPGIGEWIVVVGVWRGDGWYSGSNRAFPTIWMPVPPLPDEEPTVVERNPAQDLRDAGILLAPNHVALVDVMQQHGEALVEVVEQPPTMTCETDRHVWPRTRGTAWQRPISGTPCQCGRARW